MFIKIQKTSYAKDSIPVMVWDGKCGFCAYWVRHWKTLTEDRIVFKTFQETAEKYEDIPLKEFKKASRLIEPDGRVYSGPDSAYRSLTYSKKHHFPYHRWYVRHSLFTNLSDHTYNFIAKHRPFFYRLTVFFFGKDPENLKHYWILYLLLLLAIIYALTLFL
jgi:predicted DCC family thiol-disulfide oxidoreductase YuxK